MPGYRVRIDGSNSPQPSKPTIIVIQTDPTNKISFHLIHLRDASYVTSSSALHKCHEDSYNYYYY